MSCGNHHDTSCADVLDKLYEYLDGELDEAMVEKIAHHLDECGPCLQERERELLVSALLRRSCRCEAAPADLKVQILTRITARYGKGCPSSGDEV